MRLGLIGAGRWGKVYIRTIESLGPRLALTHWATRRPENRALIKGPVTLFSDWRRMLTAPCDAIVIATPASLHAEMTQACLEAGKPCIVEKPLCFGTATAQGLRQKAEQAGVLVLVNYIHLYNPAYQALKRAVAASGKPIRAILSEGIGWGPFRADVGTLWDRCPHDVALCLDLIGAAAGAEVTALGGLPDPQGRPEVVTLHLQWKNGAAAWIQSGRLGPQKRRVLSVLTDSDLFCFDDQDLTRCAEAHGGASFSAGRCRRIPFDYPGRTEMGGGPRPQEGEPIPVPVPAPTPMEAMLTAFADQLEKKAPPDGLGLTVEITRILEECDKLLISQNKERSCVS